MIYPHKNHIIAKPGKDGSVGRYGMKKYPKALYDMVSNPQESIDVQKKHPDVVKRIDQLADGVRADLGDGLKGFKPSSKIGCP